VVPILRYCIRTKSQWIEADVLGYQMTLDPSEFVDCALLLFPHLYDADELEFMKGNLEQGDVFMDLGAYIGLYSLAASGMVGDEGMVIAVEPDPQSFERLRHHLEINAIRNVRALMLGVTDTKQNLALEIGSPGFRAASTLLSASPGTIQVMCVPLLDVLNSNDIHHVRGVKLDIEGFEYRVLKRFFIDADKSLYPDFVIVEFHPEWSYQSGGNVIELLINHGYVVRKTQALNYIMERDTKTKVDNLSSVQHHTEGFITS
jgi:FkbM family methyltransferase